MKKDTDEIIVDLHGSDNASVRKLTEEEQLQMRKLQKELRKELGLDDESVVVNAKKEETNKQIDAFVEYTEAETKPAANITSDKDVLTEDNKVEPSEDTSFKEDNKSSAEEILTEQTSNAEDLQNKEENQNLANEDLLDENTQEEHTDNYEAFFKQYSKKDDSLDSGNFGKYDSDLDFKLNRKIKRIRLPLPKKLKVLLASLAVLIVVGSCIGLGFGLYKKPQQVYITAIAITQPMEGNEYIVSGKFVGDKLSYDHIYLLCTYSNGEVKRVPISSSMVTKVEGQVNVDGQFTSGDVVATINYGGKTVKLKYLVEQKQVASISVISTTFSITSDTVDLSNKLIVVVNYSNATSEIVNINDCIYQLDIGTGDKRLTNGVLNVGSKSRGYHTLQISYAGRTDSISVWVDQQ